jgi:sec-independent protein translocase protein TatA
MDGILAPWHWIIIIGIVLLVFGPKRLPELGSSLGKSITSFKKGLHEVHEEVSTSMAQAETREPAAPAELVAAQSSVVEGDEAKPQA